MKSKSEILVDYIKSLKDFQLVNEIDGNYGHIGATITDAILQSGINYDHVVRPRIKKILKEYKSHTTLSDFKKLIQKKGLENIINWKGNEKIKRIKSLADLLQKEGIV